MTAPRRTGRRPWPSARRVAAALLLAALSAASAGCFSIESAKLAADGSGHMLASNYGWYLFHYIPLACGNASEDAWAPWVFFRDDVTLDKIQGRFAKKAGGFGADVRDMAYTTSESVMLELPGLDIPLPIPYLLTYREIQLSGSLSRAGAAPDAAGKEAR